MPDIRSAPSQPVAGPKIHSSGSPRDRCSCATPCTTVCPVYASHMRIMGFVMGLVLVLISSVWILQGFNSQLVPQSFMTGSRLWIVIGVLTFVGGSALARLNWSRR